jgi:hypothetical protein
MRFKPLMGTLCVVSNALLPTLTNQICTIRPSRIYYDCSAAHIYLLPRTYRPSETLRVTRLDITCSVATWYKFYVENYRAVFTNCPSYTPHSLSGVGVPAAQVGVLHDQSRVCNLDSRHDGVRVYKVVQDMNLADCSGCSHNR